MELAHWLLFYHNRQRLTLCDSAYLLGKLHIATAQATHFMRTEVDAHCVPNVEPFRMVVHLFGDQRHARLEAPGIYEVAELVCSVKLAIDKLPAVPRAHCL